MYALMIARHKLYPQHKKHGMRAIKGQLIMYTSRHVRQTTVLREIFLGNLCQMAGKNLMSLLHVQSHPHGQGGEHPGAKPHHQP